MAGGQPNAAWPAFASRWQDLCADDPELRVLARGADVAFAVRSGEHVARFTFGTAAGGRAAEFTLTAAPEDWDAFFEPLPPPYYQSFFGMLMRVGSARVDGPELRFAQHAHLVRRVLELGRAAAHPAARPAAGLPAREAPAPPPADGLTGRYLTARIAGQPHRIYYEEAGRGRDLLLLHTAGADARQFHRLMSDERLRGRCRMVAFDLPWHGRSAPPPGSVPGGYSLTTDRYAETVLAVADGLGLRQPVAVGSSMAGEICLELALRHPDRFGGVVACEASDRVPGRRTPWARHPEVNQALFVPEWVDGLMAPGTPPECRSEVWWGYSQGGYAAFHGDIDFYSGEWDGSGRIAGIDTGRCPVVMLTGEYDYSCTAEMSRRTASRIPGAVFRPMPGLGHFPHAENPALFVPHLLGALGTIGHLPEYAA